MIKAHLSSTNQRQKDAPYMATSTTTVMSTGPHASLAAYSRQKATLVYAAVTHAHHLSWQQTYAIMTNTKTTTTISFIKSQLSQMNRMT